MFDLIDFGIVAMDERHPFGNERNPLNCGNSLIAIPPAIRAAATPIGATNGANGSTKTKADAAVVDCAAA